MEFKDYEKNLEELKNIVDSLESKNLSLEENMKLYKNGMKLYKDLYICLKKSEEELEIINKESLGIEIEEGEKDGDEGVISFI